jgi:hypothetical protein
MNTSLKTRIAAVAASVSLTFGVVDLMANYAYPIDTTPALFAATNPFSQSR